MATTEKSSRAAKRRLNLAISESVNERLEELIDLTDADSITEVIRRSLAVYHHLWSETEGDKAEVILRRRDGKTKRVILI